MSLPNTKDVTLENLHGEVSALKLAGCRLVTMTCLDVGEEFEVIYHFDKNYELQNLKLRIKKGQALPSISPIILAALIVENEIQDMFGIQFTGLAIDYKGRFILSDGAPKTPLARTPGIGVDARVKQPAAQTSGDQ